MTQDNSKAQELLPCPFCGIELSGPESGAYGHPIGSPDCILAYNAIEPCDFDLWNTRTPVTGSAQELVERLVSFAQSTVNNPNEQARLYLLDLACELRAALQPSPVELTAEELRHKLRMIISHASGGTLHKPEDVDRSTNDICVQISAHKNEVWKHAQEVALRESARETPKMTDMEPTEEQVEAVARAIAPVIDKPLTVIATAAIAAMHRPLEREWQAMREALETYDCGPNCSYFKGEHLIDGRCPREFEGACGKVARQALAPPSTQSGDRT